MENRVYRVLNSFLEREHDRKSTDSQDIQNQINTHAEIRMKNTNRLITIHFN